MAELVVGAAIGVAQVARKKLREKTGAAGATAAKGDDRGDASIRSRRMPLC